MAKTVTKKDVFVGREQECVAEASCLGTKVRCGG